MFQGFSIPRLIRVLIAVPALAALVAGCSSVAGMPAFTFKPQQVAANTAAAPMPAARPADAAPFEPFGYAEPAAASSGRGDVDGLIARYAALYDVPASLVHRVVKRESGYNAGARHGPYYGLMQIRHDTARSMGYRGPPAGLLDADTNLRYAVKYLRGAYMVGGYNSDAAVRNYSRGYYYDAKKLGLLEEVGLR